jgi:prepilin-type N-terminal cleavage/methylation domain-containing protein
MMNAMKSNSEYCFRQHAFTLVEMAMVLFIVGILMGGLLPVISGQVEQRRVSDTRKQLDEIQQALIGFSVINGRLPCPAVGTIATGQANAGIEATTGSGSSLTCASITSSAAGGVVPWATLGISETDAWGRRFTYRVTAIFADGIGSINYGCAPSPVPIQSSFALCSPGNLNVLNAATGGSNVANNIPAVVVSAGTNGLGAYLQTGQQVTPIPAANTDEGDNANNNNTFVSHDFVQGGFDDIVVWLSPNTLMNRMIAAGKLP